MPCSDPTSVAESVPLPGAAEVSAHRRDPAVDAEVTDLLFGMLGLMKQHLIGAVAEIGLSPQQAHALRCLVPGRPLPMRDLAAELMCDASTVTGIVDRLEQRGLVERRPDAVDRRVKSLVVTEAGVAVRDDLWQRLLTGAPHLEGLSHVQRVELRDLLRLAVSSTANPVCGSLDAPGSPATRS
ncbi:MAG: MarR family transcriptional regulator [Acidimicrobiales bacterium]